MRCVKCDGKMEYFEKNESNGRHQSHWRCSECDYTETEESRADVSVTNS